MTMEKNLTQKQRITLLTIKDFISKYGKSPTLKELQEILFDVLGLKSISSVQKHLNALKRKGYLSTERYHARGMRFNSTAGNKVNIPLIGNIAAGKPIFAEENIEAYIQYDTSKLHGDPKQYFFLRAVGTSMNTANINDKNIDNGDFVLIKSQSTADPNERIVALIDNEATVKKFKPQKDMIVLEPESNDKANKKIYIFDNDFSIQGVVKDVIKKGR